MVSRKLSIYSPRIFFIYMPKYAGQTRVLAAVDCIIFGFDGENLQVLLVKRSLAPEKNKWSLIGGFLAEIRKSGTGRQPGIEGIYGY